MPMGGLLFGLLIFGNDESCLLLCTRVYRGREGERERLCILVLSRACHTCELLACEGLQEGLNVNYHIGLVSVVISIILIVYY